MGTQVADEASRPNTQPGEQQEDGEAGVGERRTALGGCSAARAQEQEEEDEGRGSDAEVPGSAPRRPHTSPLPSAVPAAAPAPSLGPAPRSAPDEAGPSTSTAPPREIALCIFRSISRPASRGGKTAMFGHFRVNRSHKAFCEQVLEKLPHRGSPAYFVRPGLEEKFRSRVQAYVRGEEMKMPPRPPCCMAWC